MPRSKQEKRTPQCPQEPGHGRRQRLIKTEQTEPANFAATLVGKMLLAALSCGVLFAQTASIQGRITDQSGAVVPDVTVKVTNSDTGVSQRASTNSQGAYTTPFLQPGNYSISAEKQGFQTAVRSGVRLAIDQTAGIDFTLELGATTETVAVKSDAEILQTQEASVGQDIDNSAGRHR
jgi:protocatechuate 3,4-dioxygenase beta subunit